MRFTRARQATNHVFLVYFLQTTKPTSADTVGYGDDEHEMDVAPISVFVALPAHMLVSLNSQWHLKPGAGAARYFNRLVSKAVSPSLSIYLSHSHTYTITFSALFMHDINVAWSPGS